MQNATWQNETGETRNAGGYEVAGNQISSNGYKPVGPLQQ